MDAKAAISAAKKVDPAAFKKLAAKVAAKKMKAKGK